MSKNGFSAYSKKAPKSFDYNLDPPDDEPSEEESEMLEKWCGEPDYEAMCD